MAENLRKHLIDALNAASGAEIVNEVVADALLDGPFAAALAEAKTRGMRAGIERAAEVASADAGELYCSTSVATAERIMFAIRALATAAPAETEERERRQLREELAVKAEEQIAYWRKRQSAEKSLEEGVSEDGLTYTPMGDQAAWQSGYCNGRMSEADWWRQTLFYLPPASTPPAHGETATALAVLAQFVGAFEGVTTPLSEKQERAYEDAARFLDEVGARPPCLCPACRDARARAVTPPQPTATATREDGHA